jgi:exodeoxyribonuclease VII large subunit
MSQGKFNFSDYHNRDAGGFNRSPDFFVRPSDSKPQSDKPSPAVSVKKDTVYTVTQLTRLIKHTLSDYLPGKIILAGEISNCKYHGEGHLYLTLKDQNSQIDAVMWKSTACKLKFQPADGMAITATGHIDLYEPQGKYQFYLEKLEPAGLGALEMAFRQLAEKLRNEGLFEPSHKKPLPKYPTTIAIVTSDTGAAVQDISQTLNRRFPIVRQLLYPVAVQGETAAKEIAAAINEINKHFKKTIPIDLIIVGRGGGSIEDLWAFNEEIVARAIFASEIPVISAVGHEIDTTIADMVADVRAATPTAAAELAVPVMDEIIHDLSRQQMRLACGVRNRLTASVTDFTNLAKHPVFTRPAELTARYNMKLQQSFAELSQKTKTILLEAWRNLDNYKTIIGKIEPRTSLARAKSLVNDKEGLLRLACAKNYRRQYEKFDKLAARHLAASPLHRVRSGLMLTEQLDKRLSSLNPRAVLQRGYSITRLKSSGNIITSKTAISPGDVIVTELDKRIAIESQVTQTEKPDKE